MSVRRLMRVALATALLCSFSVSLSGASTPPKISASAPCGAVHSTTYTHVVWILLENQGYSVVGSPNAPYFNELSNRCALATNYFAISHPSLPNYVALTSGSTQSIADDGEPSTHRLAVPSIFSELGSKWRTLAESMPGRCDHVTSGVYAARHNPAVYYTNIAPACQRNDVPLTTPLNLSAEFTMIVPNVCHDMHSCPVADGDSWLKRFVSLIVQSPQYQSRSLVLFITFDENDLDASNQVPTLVISPSTPRGLRVGAKFTHYSLLRTTENLLHLAPLAGAKRAPSMVGPFHL
ncbi:MAG TPA: alkaline phosphatase family protein [Acidimicrobiales bacterium]|nr:alkaline phosphatase family protein [Acidimicrobiales bacterium]